jgi:PGF-CTERM protein
MTNDTNYRGKANAVFFAAVMVISMFAAGFAAAPAAAAATGNATIDGVTAQDVTGNVSGTTQTVDVQTTIGANEEDLIVIDNSSLPDAVDVTGVQVSASDANLTTATINSSSDGQTTVDIVADGTATDTDFTVEYTLDTPSAAVSGIEYTVSNGDDSSSATDTFDHVNADSVTTAQPIDADVTSSDEAVDVTVDHSTTTSPDEVSVFVLGPNGASASNTVTSVSGSETTVPVTGITGLDVEDGEDLQIHAIASSGAAAGSNVAGATNLQVAQNVTVGSAGDINVAAGDVDGDVYWTGQQIVVNTSLSAGNSVVIERVDTRNDNGYPTSTSRAREVDVGSSGAIVINTDRLRGEGDYVLTQAESTDSYLDASGNFDEALSTSTTAEFEVLDQDLSAQFADEEVNDNEATEVEVESLRGSFDVEVTAEDSDGDAVSYETLEDIFENADGFEVVSEDDDIVSVTAEDGESFEADFDGIAGDEYDFTFDAADSTASDSSTINVTELGEGDVSFEESFITQERGDNANITINFEGDTETAYLTVGDEEEVGYESNITVDSGGEDSVTVGFNTYVAGNTTTASSDLAFVADSDSDASVDVDSETPNDLSRILATGTYPVQISTVGFDENANDNADAIGDLELEERSVEGFQLWTTSADAFDDVEDTEDIANAVENDTVQQTDSLTQGDVLIHEVSATGLEGAIDEYGGSFTDLLTATDSANASTGVDIRIRETDDSRSPNTERKQVDLQSMIDDGDVSVISTEGSYYLAFNADNVELTESDRSVDDDDEFEVRVRVKDQRLLDPSSDELDEADDGIQSFYETATATFTYEEATGEFDTPVEVEAAGNQTISGTTNVAAGQEIQLRASSDSGVTPSFAVTAEDVVVQPDGTFEGTFDFSDASVNDTFTVNVRQATFSAEEDGTVVEQTGESAFFEVSELDPEEATATAGDSVTVSATIENTGGAEATQDVALTLDGDELDTTEVTLAGGASQTVEFTADTSGLDAGDYTHGVATDDDEATGTLTIETDGGEGDSTGDSEGDSTGDSEGDSTGDSEGDSTGDSEGDSEGDDSTEDGTPGFGALVALVALIAAALLATRRND